MPARSKQPFINGWAVPIEGSRILHALPSPADLGNQNESLCKKRPTTSEGWIEYDFDSEGYWFRCSPCVNRLRVMYEEDSSLLTAEDRRNYEHLVDEYDRKKDVDS